MVKIKFVDVDKGKPLPNSGFFVQFNPEKMQISEACGAVQTVKKEKEEFNTKSIVTLSLHLLFNSFTSFEQREFVDVRSAIRQFYIYTHADDKRPQKKVGVLYGSMSLVGYITSLSVTYTSFDAQGKAIRAEADLTIEGQYHGALPSNHFSDDHKIYEKKGTSFAENLVKYGSAVEWKKQAKAQKVNDPLLI